MNHSLVEYIVACMNIGPPPERDVERERAYRERQFQSEEEPEETVFTLDPIRTEIATVAAMVDAATKAETK